MPFKQLKQTETPDALKNNKGIASIIKKQNRIQNDAVTISHESNQVEQTTLDQIIKSIEKTF